MANALEKVRTVTSGDQPIGEQSKPSNEALAFVEKNRDQFDHMARGRVEFEAAPEGLNTFAFDLEKDKIYIHPRFHEQLGFSAEKTTFATMHEIQHFLEKKQMLAEANGTREFARYLGKLKDRGYGIMDNCLADIRENQAVIDDTNQSWREVETDLYKNDLFPQLDFTDRPRHIQFSEALLREARGPAGEQCIVAPEVREKIETLRNITSSDGSNFFDVLTDPKLPMSERIKLQDALVWPIVQELREKDMADRKPQQGEGQPSEGQSGNGDGKPDKSKNGKEKGGKENPNEIFSDDYATAEKRNPNAAPLDQIEKAFKEWREAVGDPLDRADAEYAKNLGVKKEDLQRYRQIVKSLDQIKNPETSLSVIEELRTLIRRIIARRLKPQAAPRYPVEEGDELVDPSELVSQVKAGNLEPKAWEDHPIQEKTGKKFGEVEVTLICDRSSSMAGQKAIEQQKAAILMMEALKELSDLADEERINLDKPLEIRSEVYTFQANPDDIKPIKAMSKELSEKDRINVSAVLSSAPGSSTTDFVPLETIDGSVTEEVKQKIIEGELKKIVIVFTDGISDDQQRVKNILEILRKQGIITIGVGVTQEGKKAVETYAPDSRLAETAEALPLVLGELLKEHLADL